MSKDYFPTRQAQLITWASNLATLVSATPTAYGATAAMATSLASANSAMSDAYAAATTPTTRTRGTVAALHNAIKAFKAEARSVVRVIQAFPALTDQQRRDLGITVHAPVSPINPPTESPAMEIVSANGRTMKVALHAIGSTGRSKPAGVQGASIFAYAGATPPADINDWMFMGQTTRTSFVLEFGPTFAAGAQVLLTAYWYNPRGQSGPACTPITAYIAGGVAPTESASAEAAEAA